MAEEKKEEKKAPEAAPKGSSLKSVIAVCLGVFLVAAAGFSWREGLFSAPAAPGVEEAQSDSTQDSTLAAASAEKPAVSPENETLAQAATHAASGTLEQSSTAGAPVEKMDAGPREDEQSIAQEKRQLAQKSMELDAKQKELERLKTEIEGLLARVQESKSERIVMMAKLYDSMDPEAVARQISSMEDRTVILLLPQMNTRTAAKVMAAIDPKRAAQITTKMLALDQ